MQIIIRNQKEMTDFAEKIANKIIKNKLYNDIFALSGDVGSGKTFFVSALINKLAKFYYSAHSEQINEIRVPSPSFNLLYHYQIDKIEILHCDLYRLDKNNVKLYYELENIGLFEYIGNKLIFIEWAEIAKEFLPNNINKLNFEFYDSYQLSNNNNLNNIEQPDNNSETRIITINDRLSNLII